MLNKWIGMGRITKPLELRHTGTGTPTVSFTIAVERDFRVNGEKVTDFINVVAWRQTAEFICKYFGKGSLICIEGMVCTRSYETNGKKVYVTEINADKVFFTGEKKETATGANFEAREQEDFTLIDIDDDLPF